MAIPRSLRVLLLALAIVPCGQQAASARVTQDFTYAYSQLWQASVRLVRVDLGYRLVDRDQETGYLVFEYSEGGRTFSGTVEIVTPAEHRARVIVQIPAAPSYVERMIVDRLARKLRDDFGEAPQVPTGPTTPRAPAVDETENERSGEPPSDPRNNRNNPGDVNNPRSAEGTR